MTVLPDSLLAGRVLSPGRRWRNWGRSQSAHPEFVARASSVDDVVATLAFARDRGLPVRPMDAGHSFSAIAATDGIQRDIAAIDGLLAVDGTDVTLGAGTHRYQLPALLKPHGLALQNMGDIDRQTIAGAISTGTHGTGARFGGLATQVVAVTLVTADGGRRRPAHMFVRDDNWLSTAYGGSTGYIAAHRYYRDDPTEYFREIETIMRAHDARPHWGKMHSRTAADLGAGYPRFAEFLAVRDRLDPDRPFANEYLSRVLGA